MQQAIVALSNAAGRIIPLQEAVLRRALQTRAPSVILIGSNIIISTLRDLAISGSFLAKYSNQLVCADMISTVLTSSWIMYKILIRFPPTNRMINGALRKIFRCHRIPCVQFDLHTWHSLLFRLTACSITEPSIDMILSLGDVLNAKHIATCLAMYCRVIYHILMYSCMYDVL